MTDPRDALIKILITGLTTDGAHHKQWALDQILAAMVEQDWYDQAHAEFQWSKGIAP